MNFDLNPPLCRATDPIESFQAADLIKTHERLIVSVLEQYGPAGVDGIAWRCKLSAHAIGKRIALTGRSVKSDSGRSQREWRKT